MKHNNLQQGRGDRQPTLNKGVIFSALALFLILFSFNLVSSAPPVTTVQDFPEGYVIVENQHSYLKLNQDYQYNFFVYNKSNGILLDNTSITCTFYLANSSGNVIFSSEVDYFSDGYWGIDIMSGNFSSIGTYPYGVSCQDGHGGSLAGIFEVISTTNFKGTLFYIILLTSLAVFFLGLTVFVDEEFFVYISGLLFLVGGIFIMINGLDVMNDVNTRYLAFIYLGIGMLFTVGAYIYNSYSKHGGQEEY